MVSGWGLRENEIPSSSCQGSRSLIECKPFLKCCLSPYRAYKTIEDEDLKFPLIYGEGKKVGMCASPGWRGQGFVPPSLHVAREAPHSPWQSVCSTQQLVIL